MQIHLLRCSNSIGGFGSLGCSAQAAAAVIHASMQRDVCAARVSQSTAWNATRDAIIIILASRFSYQLKI
jgi:hypothetical protein